MTLPLFQPSLAGDVPSLPPMARVRQTFDPVHIARDALPAAVAASITPAAAQVVQPGMRVAITAGSRGIAHYDVLVAAVAQVVREHGAQPFVLAAMGSHGGGTAEGQRAVLAGYGISEKTIGCPVECSMETVVLGEVAPGVPVHCARAAVEADAIMLLNRIKPHTILTGDMGSGLLKMAAVGMGKHTGAATLHAAGIERYLLPAARMVLERAPVCLGVAISENAFDQTRRIETLLPQEIATAEPRLLAEVRRMLPTVPFDPLDALIISRIGKNIAGTGMDPNVIGMHRRNGGPPQRTIGRIVALELTEASHGNAHGVGMADIITQHLRDKIDWQATYTNAVTSNFLAGARLPLTCPDSQTAVALALQPYDPQTVRAVWIADTAHLHEMLVSPVLLAELARSPGLSQVSEPEPLRFEGR